MLSPIYIKKLKSFMCMHVYIYIFILIFGRIHKMRVERTERSRYEGRQSIPVLFCLKKQQNKKPQTKGACSTLFLRFTWACLFRW